ncbi:MAG: phage tail terminator-like protein [Thalassobaculaceae bacterium]|nr:phage tail terminator-like protein [Thalassobaculaceae bacterium]
MTYDEARAAIESLFAGGWSATPVAYENVAFLPPDDLAPWIRLAIENRETAQASFGGGVRRFRCSGAVQVEIKVARGAGTAPAYRLAGSVCALFAETTVPGMTFDAVRTAPAPGDDDAPYFTLLAEIPFWHDDFR